MRALATLNMTQQKVFYASPSFILCSSLQNLIADSFSKFRGPTQALMYCRYPNPTALAPTKPIIPYLRVLFNKRTALYITRAKLFLVVPIFMEEFLFNVKAAERKWKALGIGVPKQRIEFQGSFYFSFRMNPSRSALFISHSRANKSGEFPPPISLVSKTSLSSVQSQNDLYELSLEEIVAQFKVNPFFRVKVTLLEKRRKLILDMAKRDCINLNEFNPEEIVSGGERVNIKTGKYTALRGELEQIAAIFKAVGLQ